MVYTFFAACGLRDAIYLHLSSLEVYYNVKLWLVPPKLGDKVWKSRRGMVGGFPKGVSRPKTRCLITINYVCSIFRRVPEVGNIIIIFQ